MSISPDKLMELALRVAEASRAVRAADAAREEVFHVAAKAEEELLTYIDLASEDDDTDKKEDLLHLVVVDQALDESLT